MIAVATAAHIVAYPSLYPLLGLQVGVFVTFPVIITAWLFGAKGGLIAGVMTFPLNSALATLTTGTEYAEFLRVGGVIGSTAEALVGYVIGLIRDLRARAQEYVTELRLLQKRMIDLQEEERRAIAGELHDEIGQELVALKLMVDQAPPRSSGRSKTTADPQSQIIDDLISRVRDLSLNLRPLMLDDLGLISALESLLKRYTENTQVEVNFDRGTVDGRFDPRVEIAAYRMVQEGLTNVARHAGIKHATVALSAADGSLRVSVQDQGVGFNPAEVMSPMNTVGLAAMRERVEALKGTLNVDSAAGEGTALRAEFPLNTAT